MTLISDLSSNLVKLIHFMGAYTVKIFLVLRILTIFNPRKQKNAKSDPKNEHFLKMKTRLFDTKGVDIINGEYPPGVFFEGSQIFEQKNKGSQLFRRKFKGPQINFKV